MKYMGSKSRFAKEILNIVLKDRKEGQWYVEPFCGGCNVIDKVNGNRMANDVHPYLIDMWKALVNDKWTPPKITKDDYNEIRTNRETFTKHLVGYVGFNASYSGKWFGGFAGQVNTKTGLVRDYQDEAIRNIEKQIPNLQGVIFTNKNYREIEIPENSIVYCDPPYEGTTEYANQFDHRIFWDWIRQLSVSGHKVYVSEYNAPEDFKCIWSKTATSSLSANGKCGGNKNSIERLFIYDNI